jgi:lantibiotic modifying enzyme
MKALVPVRSELHDVHSRQRLSAQIGLGGADGLSSILYCFSVLAEILNDRSLHNEAAAVASLIAERRADSRSELDVVSGIAGCLLCMLRFFAASPTAGILQQLTELGDTLIAAQDSETGGWASDGPRPLCGFSHGAAGICLALLRLYHYTGDDRYLRAAEGGWAYERRVFIPEALNWPDFRDTNSGNAVTNAWCHGACGIGLARLAGFKYYRDETALKEFSIAMDSVRAEKSTRDHVCCGNFGLLEFLNSAAGFTGDKSLLELARCRAASLVQRAGRHGNYRWPAGNDEDNPGFFTGLAGIGYTLLRLGPRPNLPCIITWN